MKKNLLCLILTVLMIIMLTGEGLAAEDLSGRTIANGTVAAAEYTDVTAPFSGILLPFRLEAGDTVREGEKLFELMTVTVRAPEDGTVSWMFAAEGDDADAVNRRYGMLGALEPAQLKLISATTQGAYNKDENRLLRVGEILYFRVNENGGEEGNGRVTAVSDSGYTVEILEGDFDLGKTLTLYRKDGYDAKDSVGRGTVVRRSPVGISGTGRVWRITARNGDSVRMGDPLLTLMPQDADQGASPEVLASSDGIISQMPVTTGQQVWKGQMLCRIEKTERLEIIAQVDEVDLPGVKIGDVLPVTLDQDRETVFRGVVTEISGLGITRQNAAYYDVRLSITETGLPLGASASVYLPEQ